MAALDICMRPRIVQFLTLKARWDRGNWGPLLLGWFAGTELLSYKWVWGSRTDYLCLGKSFCNTALDEDQEKWQPSFPSQGETVASNQDWDEGELRISWYHPPGIEHLGWGFQNTTLKHKEMAQDICLGVGFLEYRVILYLVFWGISILFSIVVIPAYFLK